MPGVPGILLGHNAHIAWSLTDTQNSATFYYKEQVRGSRYYWNGAWRPLTVVHYSIPVRGGATRQLTVDITAQGPIMSQAGQTMAVDWMGNVPSGDVTALLAVNTASTSRSSSRRSRVARADAELRLRRHRRPHRRHRPRLLPAGARRLRPWLPMAGSGACDVTGVIPYQAAPQSYDPPSHLIATANQRPVSGDYPYYVGTALDFYDPGYRAAHAYRELTAAEPLTTTSIARLQNDLADPLAARLPPAVPERAVRRRAVRHGQGRRGAARLVERPDEPGIGRGVAVVDLLGQLPQRGLRPVVARGQGPGERGPHGPRPVGGAGAAG